MESRSPDERSAWTKGWRVGIKDRLRDLGYDDILDLLRSNPALSYTRIARVLGQGVAPVQVEQLHVESTRAECWIEEALDSLARNLCEALGSRGWGVGARWRVNVVSAFAGWIVRWGREPECKQFRDALFAAQPPKGWKPVSRQDPVLQSVLATTGLMCVN